MAEGDLETPSHINATGRPTLKELHRHVVMKVADKWRDLGVQLLRSDQERMLNIIKADHPHDSSGCCKDLFEKWLETNADATWEVLIKALKSPTVHLDYLSSQLEKMLMVTEDKPMPSPSKPESQKTPESHGKKHKSQLNELFQKYGVTDKEYSSSYDITDGNVHNFKATLTYTVHERKYQYESRGVFGRKQDAEEDVAQQALCEFDKQLKKPGGVSYKKMLKERYYDKRQLPAPKYTTQSSGGGFVSTVNVPQYKPVTGSESNSKKDAEQLAAMEALRQLKLL